MSGWIKLHRELQKWEWYTDSKMVHLLVHLILSANHAPKSWQGIKVERGQVIVGRKRLSADTGISEQSIRTCLKKLESTNEITIKPTNKNSLITILKYDFYQLGEDDKPSNQPAEQPPKQPTKKAPKKPKKKPVSDNYKSEYTVFFSSTEFVEAWGDYMQVRTSKKASKTDRALKGVLKKLMKFTLGDITKAVNILDKSSNGGWTDVFQLKEKDNKKVSEFSEGNDEKQVLDVKTAREELEKESTDGW